MKHLQNQLKLDEGADDLQHQDPTKQGQDAVAVQHPSQISPREQWPRCLQGPLGNPWLVQEPGMVQAAHTEHTRSPTRKIGW